jgi:imidazolonepropionase-like amidohydrolase
VASIRLATNWSTLEELVENETNPRLRLGISLQSGRRCRRALGRAPQSPGNRQVRGRRHQSLRFGRLLSKGDQPGTPQYTLEELQAIAEEAHKLGRKVAAHAHGTQSIKDAIRAGIDSIEHSSLIDDEGIALAKQHGTYLVFDIYNDDYILQEGAKAGMLPESIEKENKIGRQRRENFRHAFQSGARMAFGTDSGVYPHGDNAKQFAKMVVGHETP